MSDSVSRNSSVCLVFVMIGRLYSDSNVLVHVAALFILFRRLE